MLQSILVVGDGKGYALQVPARAYGDCQRDFIDYRQQIAVFILVSAQNFFYIANYVIFFVDVGIISVRLEIIEIHKRTSWR